MKRPERLNKCASSNGIIDWSVVNGRAEFGQDEIILTKCVLTHVLVIKTRYITRLAISNGRRFFTTHVKHFLMCVGV